MNGPRAAKEHGSDLWVITTYFNPARWSSRIENYRAFRRMLGVPLLAVEWDPSRRYELSADDADILIQIDGGDYMWQKERLLGIALAGLPEHVAYVAWLDCDVIFADPTWLERTRALLERRTVIQPFRQVAYLDAGTTRRVTGNEPLAMEFLLRSAHATRPSFLDLFERVGDDIARVDLGRRFEPDPGDGLPYDIMARPAYGHAWAARVDALRRIGWYERCVLGGGDLLFAYGLIGRGEEMIANQRSFGWDFYGGASYREWARAGASETSGSLACTDGALLHLFHGTLGDRQYRSRIDGLARFGLDIDLDIAAANGAPWSWTRSGAELSDYFLSYLRNRHEDG